MKMALILQDVKLLILQRQEVKEYNKSKQNIILTMHYQHTILLSN